MSRTYTHELEYRGETVRVQYTTTPLMTWLGEEVDRIDLLLDGKPSEMPVAGLDTLKLLNTMKLKGHEHTFRSTLTPLPEGLGATI